MLATGLLSFTFENWDEYNEFKPVNPKPPFSPYLMFNIDGENAERKLLRLQVENV